MNPERGLAAAAALCEYFAPHPGGPPGRTARRSDQRAGRRRDRRAETSGDEEIYSFLRLLLPAGVETTYRSLGNLLLGLLSDPSQLNAVRDDRALIPHAIEEGVRWEPPLLTITRTATRDTELGGLQIPAGSSVMPMLGAANRQEDRWPDPDRFDIFRPARSNLGWGHGARLSRNASGPARDAHGAQSAVRSAAEPAPGPDGNDPHIRGQVFRSPTSVPVLFDV